jgi:hypothetical protein
MSRRAVVLRDRAAAFQTQSDPEGGIPSGSLEVTWEETKNLGQRVLVSLSKETTQTSDGFLLLQSTACWRTKLGPESR